MLGTFTFGDGVMISLGHTRLAENSIRQQDTIAIRHATATARYLLNALKDSVSSVIIGIFTYSCSKIIIMSKIIRAGMKSIN